MEILESISKQELKNNHSISHDLALIKLSVGYIVIKTERYSCNIIEKCKNKNNGDRCKNEPTSTKSSQYLMINDAYKKYNELKDEQMVKVTKKYK